MGKPPEIFSRELLIFVGKGGVGKTTTSAAVALRLARDGRRTLLVTVDPAKRLKDSLGVEIGHRPKEVRKNLWAMMLDPERVIEEYVREEYPDRDLTKHPFYKYISNYMPGINEVLAIGQLIEFRREKDFETIVVDTAPTGHALSFLTTPLAVRELFRENLLLRWALRGYSIYQKLAQSGRALSGVFGKKEKIPPAPDVDFEALFRNISEHVGEIQDLMADRNRTTLSIVTLPERLPVEETLDLFGYIQDRLTIRPAYVIVNKVQPDALGTQLGDFDRLAKDANARSELGRALASLGYSERLVEGLMAAAEFNEIRRKMNEEHIADLRKRLPDVPLVLLPLHRRDIAGLERLEMFEREFFQSLATHGTVG